MFGMEEREEVSGLTEIEDDVAMQDSRKSFKFSVSLNEGVQFPRKFEGPLCTDLNFVIMAQKNMVIYQHF